MASKKDYAILAAAINKAVKRRKAYTESNNVFVNNVLTSDMLHAVVDEIVRALSAYDNFDAKEFLTACDMPKIEPAFRKI